MVKPTRFPFPRGTFQKGGTFHSFNPGLSLPSSSCEGYPSFPKGNIMTNMFGLRAELLLPGQKLKERKQSYRLRFLNDFGRMEASDPQIGEECDGLDDVSPTIAVFAVIDGQEVMVACVRILLCTNGPITVDPILVNGTELHGEVSRFTVDKRIENRLLRKQIRFLLCSMIAEYAFGELGYKTLYCDAREHFYQILRGCMGDSLETLGPKHEAVKKGQLVSVVPCCIRSTSVPAIRERFIRMLDMLQARECRRQPELPIAEAA